VINKIKADETGGKYGTHARDEKMK